MNEIILDNIPIQIDFEGLAQRVHVQEGSEYMDSLRRVADEAQAIARPKAVYRVGFIGERGEDTVVVEGLTFTSRVLRVNLESAHRVFLYLATCGTELYEWGNALEDVLERYWAEAIQVMALRSATRALNDDIAERHRPGKMSSMAPGSLGNWPLREQRPLFALLGDTKKKVGVRLSESLLMIPSKSVSGIRFPTEESFESCQLCPREDCPGRRAPHDASLYDRKYRPQEAVA